MSDTRNTNFGARTPLGGSCQIVAMFESYDRACAAREALVAAGIDRTRVEVLDRSGAAEDTSFRYERNDAGTWGAIKRLFMPDEDTHLYAEGISRGHAVVVVRAGADEQERIERLLEDQGAMDVDAGALEWRASGWSGVHAGQSGWQMPRESSPRDTTGGANAGTDMAGRAGEEVIPVYQEQLRVGKRDVSRGSVRIRSYVVEEPVEEQVTLRDERVEIERRPATGQHAAEPGADVFRERTVEVSGKTEEAVVSKDARLKEEIVVRKEPEERTETVRDTVRRTEVEVEDQRAPEPVTRSPKT